MEATEFRFERWRRRTATGAVLTGIALGLREALESEKELPAMVQPVPSGGDGGGPRPVELRLDPDYPAATVAIVRPWLWR
jgi:hypothetical protein